MNNKSINFLLISWIFINQVATTIYLPSLPEIMVYFKSFIPSQLVFTSYLLSYTLTQFIYGPLSDYFGIKKAALASLFMIIVGSALATFSTNLFFLITATFIQGMGSGGLSVLSRIILANHFSDEIKTRISSYLSMAFAISPLLGPLIGGFLQELFCWQANFLFIFIISSLLFLITWKFFSVKKISYHRIKLQTYVQDYLSVVKNKTFLAYISCGIIGIAIETSYEISAPFLLEQRLGLASSTYGVINSIPLIGYLLGSFLMSVLTWECNLFKAITFSSTFIITGGLFMYSLGWANIFNSYAVVLPMLISMIGLGIMFPCSLSGSLSLNSATSAAATLSAGLQNLAGVITSLLISIIPMKTQNPLGIILISGGMMVFILTNFKYILDLKKNKRLTIKI